MLASTVSMPCTVHKHNFAGVCANVPVSGSATTYIHNVAACALTFVLHYWFTQLITCKDIGTIIDTLYPTQGRKLFILCMKLIH